MITAIKPIFDRQTQTFNVTVVENADVLLAHEGYLVYDDAAKVLQGIREGKMLTNWTPRKRQAAIDWLESRVGQDCNCGAQSGHSHNPHVEGCAVYG